MAVRVRSYLSPTLVLLAFDWTEGRSREDFLGFAIKRTPGFTSPDGQSETPESWLPNRLTFEGPVPDTQADAPSRIAPIQKFMWWDARIEPGDRRKTFRYDVYPVVGHSADPTLLEHEAAAVTITLPAHIEDGIGTWFNRAVVSSQAFSRQLKTLGIARNESPPPEAARALRTWLANDLEQTFAEIFSSAHEAAAAVYHLTDPLWAIPAFESFGEAHGKDKLALVYDAHTVPRKGGPPAPSPNAVAVAALAEAAICYPRERTHIMHNKFIVASDGETRGAPMQLLTGSANFTTEGITEQANVLHTFASPALAARYAERAHSLAGDPSIAETAKLAPGWSAPVEVGRASVRVSFSPEPKGSRSQIDTIVEAIGNASHSVLFCLFMPTDEALRDACFQAGDNGLMMFGLVNHISAKQADEAPGDDGTLDAAPNSPISRSITAAATTATSSMPATSRPPRCRTASSPSYASFPAKRLLPTRPSSFITSSS